MNPDTYKLEMEAEFKRLLDAAEKKNLLYFLMTLFHGMAALRWSTLFVAHVNEITSRLVIDRANRGPGNGIPPHEILFALQINLEAKAVVPVYRPRL